MASATCVFPYLDDGVGVIYTGGGCSKREIGAEKGVTRVYWALHRDLVAGS